MVVKLTGHPDITALFERQWQDKYNLDSRTMQPNSQNYQKTIERKADEPFVIVISGTFCAGKTDLKNELFNQMSGENNPVRVVLNYKLRDPKTYELPGVDYLLVETPEEFERLKKEGQIVAPYTRDEHSYGLSRAFLDALQAGSMPIMEMQLHGYGNLRQYLAENSLPNRVVSFLLHTTYTDAKERLFLRSGRELSPNDIEFIQSHIRTLEDEFANYRIHESSFRHVISNPTDSNITKYEAIDHLARRVNQIVDLEGLLGHRKPAEFREGYVDAAARNIFGMSAHDAGLNSKRGIRLNIPDELVKMYSIEQKIPESAVREAAKKKVIGHSSHYGILTLYFEEIKDPEQKKILIGLIQSLSRMEYQHMFPEILQAKTSRLGLTEIDPKQKDGFIDSFVSFSPYDPMKAPKADAKVHTLAFESIHGLKEPRIEPVSLERAIKVIEGNGRA